MGRLILLLLFMTMASPFADALPMVYVVRHAEKQADAKDPKDPPLSLAGEARAKLLAQMLAASGVKAIYTTQYARTIQLSSPLARALNITPVIHPAGDTAGLIKKITSHGADEAVLVVGHSNTVPEILNGLGYSGEVKIAEEEFDNLFVLVSKSEGSVSLERLKY